MDDKGQLRNPNWIRRRSLEERLANAKVKPLFAPFASDSPPVDYVATMPELRSLVEEPEWGSIILLRGRTPRVPQAAAQVLYQLAKLHGKSIRWVSAEGYIEMFKESWKESTLDDPRNRNLKYIQRAFDVVVLDGLGLEPGTPFDHKTLGSLIKGRHESTLTTIVVTSLTPLDMAVYGGRVAAYCAESPTINI